jgi:hypothetical protein
MKSYSNNTNRSLAFLKETIRRRLDDFLQKENHTAFSFPAIELEADESPLHQFFLKYEPNVHEFTILVLALMPHILPNFIDTIIQHYLPNGGDFPEIGGARGNNHRGTIPTGETALFIVAGNDIFRRMHAMQYFASDHFFTREDILALEEVKTGEPRMSGRIILQQDYVDLITTGSTSKPTFGPDFPAKNISTKMDWSDLVLNPKTAQQIQDIKTWLDHNEPFMKEWGMEKKVKPGFRALFYGPPGTGKTLTATLLGKQFNKEVYRIDLSQVVSKYIGETEKNLEKVFDKAQHKDWILFFDEADALFGKRSNVSNAHDKYANQEVSYLLQRVEDFPGLIILASNFKSNIDNAFIRRFNAIVPFAMPNAAERLQIWKTSIPAKAVLAADVDLAVIASIIHYASLQAIARGEHIILKCDLLEGVQREYEKEEMVFIK